MGCCRKNPKVFLWNIWLFLCILVNFYPFLCEWNLKIYTYFFRKCPFKPLSVFFLNLGKIELTGRFIKKNCKKSWDLWRWILWNIQTINVFPNATVSSILVRSSFTFHQNDLRSLIEKYNMTCFGCFGYFSGNLGSVST